MTRKAPPPHRTDDQLIAEMHAHLNWKHSTVTATRMAARIGPDLAKRLINKMTGLGMIETYRAMIGGHMCDIYCPTGQAPKPVTPTKGAHWSDTLAGFRAAVQAARAAGNDPFKVVCA